MPYLGCLRRRKDLERALPREPGVHGMLGRKLGDQIDSLLRDFIDPPSTLGLDRLQAVHSSKRKAATPSAGAVPERMCLEEHDSQIREALAQVPRSGDAGEPAAHDGYVSEFLTE